MKEYTVEVEGRRYRDRVVAKSAYEAAIEAVTTMEDIYGEYRVAEGHEAVTVSVSFRDALGSISVKKFSVTGKYVPEYTAIMLPY